MPRTISSADGCEIAHEAHGTGPALVIVNGAFGTRSTGAPLAAALQDSFTVYRYDRRGRGDSRDHPPYAVQREYEDLKAVVDVAGGDAFVYGHSSGAALVLDAIAGGVPARGLLIHEPPYVPGPGTSRETAAELAELAAAGRGDEATERFMRNTGMPEAMLAQTKASPAWPQLVALAPTLAYDVLQCNQGVVPVDRLAEISCPVLASAGELSPGWARESVQMVAAAVADCEWRLLDGQSHNVAPDVLAALAREHFLA